MVWSSNQQDWGGRQLFSLNVILRQSLFLIEFKNPVGIDVGGDRRGERT